MRHFAFPTGPHGPSHHRQRPRHRLALALVAVTLLAAAATGHAGHNGDEHFWDEGVDGTFGAPGFWSEGAPPGSGEFAIFNVPGEFTVDFDADHDNDRLRLHDGAVTFDLMFRGIAHTYALTNPTASVPDLLFPDPTDASIAIGDESGDQASLVLAGGAITGVQARLGNEPDSSGTLHVTGDQAQVELSSALYVGFEGTGTLAIEDGAGVVNTSSVIGTRDFGANAVTVTGAESHWTNNGTLTIGGEGTHTFAEAGAGSLTIADGATVSSGSATVGSQSGSTGSATVTGAGSSWQATGRLFVGHRGTGTLVIEEGAAVSSNGGSIGSSTDDPPGSGSGVVNVSGQDTSWTNTSRVIVGATSSGSMSVQDGAEVVSTGGSIGTSGDGDVTIMGEGSSWVNTGSLRIGFRLTAGSGAGHGVLSIAHGGHLSNTDVHIGRGTGSSGHVEMIGPNASWTADGSFYVAGDEEEAGGAGSVTIGPGAALYIEGLLRIWDEGVVNVHGGAIRFDDRTGPGQLNFTTGTVEVGGDRMVGVDAVVDELFGSAVVLPSPVEFGIGGTATLLAPVTVDGGTFSVGDLVGGGLLAFDAGTFRMTEATLSIAGSGQLGDDVAVGSNQSVHAAAGASLATDGRLTVHEGGRFLAEGITNRGLITGGGRVDADITNLREPVVSGVGRVQGEIRVSAGERLVVAGTIANRSRIDVMPGGELEATGPVTTGQEGGTFTNDVPGEIFLRDATLRLPDRPIATGPFTDAGLVNRVGTLGFSFGTSDVFGTIFNASKGTIIVSGDAQVSFYNAVRNDGEVRLSGDSTAAWFGDVTGSGSFTGPGTHMFEGGLSPGNSTAALSFGGDVVLGPGASTRLTLGGMQPGDEHDQLNVAGEITLAGTLEVALMDNADETIAFWQPIELITAGTITGSFDELLMPELNSNEFLTLHTIEQSVNVMLGLVGDMNLDGVVDTGDVAPFVLALTNPEAYEAEYGIDPALVGDINQDGAFDTGDVAPFVQMLVAGGTQSVPEPGSLVLLGLGGLMLLGRRQFRDRRTLPM